MSALSCPRELWEGTQWVSTFCRTSFDRIRRDYGYAHFRPPARATGPKPMQTGRRAVTGDAAGCANAIALHTLKRAPSKRPELGSVERAAGTPEEVGAKVVSAKSAPGLGPPLATSAPGLGPPLPHLRRD